MKLSRLTLALAPVFSAMLAHAQFSLGPVGVDYNTNTGTYRLVSKARDQVFIRDAHAEIEAWSFANTNYKRSVTYKAEVGELGRARRMTIACEVPGGPTLLQEFSLYTRTNSYVVIRTGLSNNTAAPIRVKEFKPMTGGVVFPGSPWSEVRTLNGDSACAQAQVMPERFRSSANNLLLTLKQDGQRRSLVLGGLNTAEFTKWARTTPEGGFGLRAAVLDSALPGAHLASYLDCGGQERSTPPTGPAIAPVHAQSFTFSQSEVDGALASVLFDYKEINFDLSGLDPLKRYALGVSWWDCDGNGRVETVTIAGDGKTNTLAAARPLPSFKDKKELPTEWAAAIDPALLSSGKCRLTVRTDKEKLNAVVSEVWIWELTGTAEIPASWTNGHPVKNTPAPANATLGTLAEVEALDPVGKLVEPGELFWPNDTFYVDAGTADPFLALEHYGQTLAAATHASPHIYDFPTICAWYAGVWKTEGAQNHPEKSSWKINTTPGLVEEMDKVRERGFLKYSRLAGRLVPDTYEPINPQGWWDDVHWQKAGYYVAPYETSQKFGQAMHERGGLAFTYFQPTCTWSKSLVSRDFREQHVDWLCGKDTNRTLDYTSPAVKAHMRQVTDAMRGGIDGMMVDYCDEFWQSEVSLGGFADPKATSTSFYRSFFQYLKSGLGTNSWLHERNLSTPNNDLTLGIVDSQRTSGDTDKISPDMVSRSGLRWYKNRVVLNYDMDSKELISSWKVDGFTGSDTDGRRMMLTMAHIAASRLLLANSLRNLPANTLYDLERVFPFYSERRSARPVDAFVSEGWPRVYEFDVTPKWRQVVLYNSSLPTHEAAFSVPMSGGVADGSLGLDPAREYYAFDFWNHNFVGRIKGSAKLEQVLRPGEARMLAIHEVESNPQFLSANRHIMQGYLDMERHPSWDANGKTLSGVSKVVGGETYEIVLAPNGYRLTDVTAVNSKAHLEPMSGPGGLTCLKLDSDQNASVEWTVHAELIP